MSDHREDTALDDDRPFELGELPGSHGATTGDDLDLRAERPTEHALRSGRFGATVLVSTLVAGSIVAMVLAVWDGEVAGSVEPALAGLGGVGRASVLAIESRETADAQAPSLAAATPVAAATLAPSQAEPGEDPTAPVDGPTPTDVRASALPSTTSPVAHAPSEPSDRGGDDGDPLKNLPSPEAALSGDAAEPAPADLPPAEEPEPSEGGDAAPDDPAAEPVAPPADAEAPQEPESIGASEPRGDLGRLVPV